MFQNKWQTQIKYVLVKVLQDIPFIQKKKKHSKPEDAIDLWVGLGFGTSDKLVK